MQSDFQNGRGGKKGKSSWLDEQVQGDGRDHIQSKPSGLIHKHSNQLTTHVEGIVEYQYLASLAHKVQLSVESTCILKFQST